MKNFSQNPITKRFIEVLNYLLNNKKVKSKAMFCAAIDYLPQSLNFVVKGERDIPVEQISKLCIAYPEINPDWLLTGNGEMERKITGTGSPGSEIEELKEKLADKEKIISLLEKNNELLEAHIKELEAIKLEQEGEIQKQKQVQ